MSYGKNMLFTNEKSLIINFLKWIRNEFTYITAHNWSIKPWMKTRDIDAYIHASDKTLNKQQPKIRCPNLGASQFKGNRKGLFLHEHLQAETRLVCSRQTEPQPQSQACIAFLPRQLLRICQVMCQSSGPSGRPHISDFKLALVIPSISTLLLHQLAPPLRGSPLEAH